MKKIIFLLMLLLFASSCNDKEKGDKITYERKTYVTISGEKFLINGEPTYKGREWNGHKIEGLLMNSRMVQGIFDDYNETTKARWKYPDTQTWDPERNTNEFVLAMDEWYDHGLLAFTINLQGGSPLGYSNSVWHNSAFEQDGSLRDDYMKRLEKILDKADKIGMVPILGIFYFGQDQYLKDGEAVKNAVRSTINWLFEKGYKNVIIELANEANNSAYDQNLIKQDSIHILMNIVRNMEKNGYKYLVGTSFNGNTLPSPNVVEVSDFILIHGNGVNNPERITEMIEQVRAMENYKPMPILFNEDDHFDFEKPINNMVNAVTSYASWGYFDYRMDGESFENGFQSVPVDWKISSERKKAFFNKVKEVTGK